MNLDRIEPLAKLGIEKVNRDAECAEFAIPLAGNRNDKGTLFAGSQYSALVLAGWYHTSAWAEEQGLPDQVAIKDAQVSYPKPATSDLRVVARFDQAPDQRPSGHWRACVTVEALDRAGEVVARLKGDYRVLVGATGSDGHPA